MFNLIRIIFVEDTYFLKEEVPENIKFNYELVKINYMDKSPFKDGDIIFLQKGKYLYLWFVRYKLDKNKINIPESYLIAKNSSINSGFIILNKKGSFNILVIKNGELESQITYKKKPVEIEKKLKLLEKEYSLANPKILDLKDFKYNYDFKDIYIFSNFDLSKEKILKSVLSNIAIPATVILIGITAYKIADYKYLVHLHDKLEKEYLALKKRNKEIKEKIKSVQEKSEFWKSFIERELKYPIAINILYKVSKVINSYEGFILNVAYTPQLTSMTIGLPKKRKGFIDKMLKTGLFKDIKILTITPDRFSKDFEVLQIELYPKEIVR